MRAIKIDIQEEVMDLPERRNYFFYRPYQDDYSKLLTEKELSECSISLQKEEYRLYLFNNPLSKDNLTWYLIKPKQKDLVDRLVKIEQDLLDAKIYHEVYCARVNENTRIRRLPWWKRLFNLLD